MQEQKVVFAREDMKKMIASLLDSCLCAVEMFRQDDTDDYQTLMETLANFGTVIPGIEEKGGELVETTDAWSGYFWDVPTLVVLNTLKNRFIYPDEKGGISVDNLTTEGLHGVINSVVVPMSRYLSRRIYNDGVRSKDITVSEFIDDLSAGGFEVDGGNLIFTLPVLETPEQKLMYARKVLLETPYQPYLDIARVIGMIKLYFALGGTPTEAAEWVNSDTQASREEQAKKKANAEALEKQLDEKIDSIQKQTASSEQLLSFVSNILYKAMVDDGITVSEQDIEDLTNNIRLYTDMAKTISTKELKGTDDSTVDQEPKAEPTAEEPEAE